jgi:hypothetical protein
MEGFGLTEQDAKNNALKNIVTEMAAFLARQTPPLTAWRPTIDYVKRFVLLDEGSRGEDIALQEGSAKSWVYPLKPLDLGQLRIIDDEAQEIQRLQRRQDRIRWGTRLFGVYVLALAALTFYFKARAGRPPRGCEKHW